MTRQSATQPVSPAKRPSDHPPPSHCLYDSPISPSACPSATRLSDHHYDSSARPSVIPHDSQYPRFNSISSSHEWGAITRDSPYTRFEPIPSSREWEQSRKAKNFHRAFTNYDLPLRALDASSIYLRDLRHVAPPKSGEDAHVTHGKCDFGRATLNNPSLGFSYVLPRLWDPVWELDHHLMSLEIDLEH